MKSREIEIVNPTGLHLRPAGILCQASMKFKSKIMILYKDKEINAKRQENEPDSVLNFYRALANLRNHPSFQEVFVYGKTEPFLEEEQGIMAYYRRGQNKDILVAGNFLEEVKEIEVKENIKEVLLSNDIVTLEENKLLLQPFQVVVLNVEKERK